MVRSKGETLEHITRDTRKYLNDIEVVLQKYRAIM
jgi:hypothetical protein